MRGCLSIEVNGRTVRTFRIVRYIVVSAVEGCPLGGGPLYYFVCSGKPIKYVLVIDGPWWFN